MTTGPGLKVTVKGPAATWTVNDCVALAPDASLAATATVWLPGASRLVSGVQVYGAETSTLQRAPSTENSTCVTVSCALQVACTTSASPCWMLVALAVA